MDKLTFGLTVMLIGISIVFLGLAILIGLIKILTVLSGGKSKAEKTEKTIVLQEQISSAEEQLFTPEPEHDAEDNATVIAAITAAISCIMVQQNGSFRVKHIRRIIR